MNEDLTDRLHVLEQKLAKKRAPDATKREQVDGHSMAQVAWRMVTELVAGLAIGFGVGYGLDVVFKTEPIFMVVFVIAGLGAGVKTMMATAGEVQAKSETVAEMQGDGTGS